MSVFSSVFSASMSIAAMCTRLQFDVKEEAKNSLNAKKESLLLASGEGSIPGCGCRGKLQPDSGRTGFRKNWGWVNCGCKTATAGNRTRVARVAGEHHTTRPRLLDM